MTGVGEDELGEVGVFKPSIVHFCTGGGYGE